MQLSASNKRILTIFVLSSGMTLYGLLLGIKSFLVAVVVAIITYGAIIIVWSIPMKTGETPEKAQELEKWLYSQGYVQFWGKVTFDEDNVIFELGEDRKSYPIIENKTRYGEYDCWKYGPYLIVRAEEPDTKNRYYVQM